MGSRLSVTVFRISWFLEVMVLAGSDLVGLFENFQSMEAFGSLSCKVQSNMRVSPFMIYRCFWDVIVEAAEDTIDKSSKVWNNLLQLLCGEVFFELSDLC